MMEVLLAIAMTAALVAAGVRFAGWFAHSFESIERWTAGVVVAYVGIVVVAQGLGAFGVLGRAGFLFGSAILVGVAFLLPHRTAAAGDSTAPSSAVDRWLVAIGATGVGLVAVLWLWRGVAQPVLVVSDGPIYHLPFAVRWLQDGSLTRTWTPFGELAATYFPGNGEIWFCWLLAMVGDDRLAKVGQWFFLLPTVLALCGLARSVHRGPWSVWPGVLWCACSLTYVSSAIPDVDLPMTFCLVAGLLLLDRGWGQSDGFERRRVLTLAALSFGAAMGTKSIGLLYAGPPMLLVLTLLRSDLKGLFCVVAASLLAGGYWYARNLFESGNPLYPLRLSLGSATFLDGWYDAAVMRQSSDYHSPVDNMAFLQQLLRATASPAIWIVSVTSIAGGLFFAIVRAKESASRTLALCVGMAVLWALSFWFVQPYNTQQRFLLPALAAGFVPLGCFRGWLGLIPLAGVLVAVAQDLVGSRAFDLRTFVAGAVLASVAGLWIARPSFGLFVALIAAPIAALAAPTISIRRDLESLALFYSTKDFGARLFPAWMRIQAAVEAKDDKKSAVIGYAGTNLPYYLAGPKLENRVRYVNIRGEAHWLPHNHFRALRVSGASPGESAFPQWHRDKPDMQAWLRNLDALSIDYFLVARENYHGRPDAPAVASFPVEYEWLTANPKRFERLGPPPGPSGEEPWGIAFRVRRDVRTN
jgi:hypothetical protein